MNDTERIEAIAETTDHFDHDGKAVRVERFDPGPGATAPVLLLHGADGLRYRGASYRGMARDLARQGYLTLLVHYFDSTGNVAASPAHFFRWIQTVTDALDYAGRQPGMAAQPVGLIGFSLGAYLALAAAAQDNRVGAVVDCFGGIPDLYPAGLPLMPPVLILHGADDPVVPVAEAYKLERLLRAGGMACEIHVYPGQGHRFHGVDAEDAFARAVDFLKRHLKVQADSGAAVASASESESPAVLRKGPRP